MARNFKTQISLFQVSIYLWWNKQSPGCSTTNNSRTGKHHRSKLRRNSICCEKWNTSRSFTSPWSSGLLHSFFTRLLRCIQILSLHHQKISACLVDQRFLIGSQNTWDTLFLAKSLEDARFFRDTRFLTKSLEDARFLVLMY